MNTPIKNVKVDTTETPEQKMDRILERVTEARHKVRDAMDELREREYELTQYLVENRMIDFLKPNEARMRAVIRHQRNFR